MARHRPTATNGKRLKTTFWIFVGIDSVLLVLVFLSILSQGFTNAAPEVGGQLALFLLLPMALGVAVWLFKLSDGAVANRLALLMVLVPVPGVIAYGFYQDDLAAKNAHQSSKEVSVGAGASEDAQKPAAGTALSR